MEELRGERVKITREPNNLTFVNDQISLFFTARPNGANIEIGPAGFQSAIAC